MKIYIASPHDFKEHCWRLAYSLQSKGHEIVSSWLDQDFIGYKSDMSEEANRDIDDILKADYVVVLNFPKSSSRGGYHTELGIALALRKPVILVGEKSNVFHHLVKERNIVEHEEDFCISQRIVKEVNRIIIEECS